MKTINRYTKIGNFTNHKEADFTLLQLYSPPYSVVSLYHGTAWTV